MMNNIYPLEFFDSLIFQTLNPRSANVEKLTNHDVTIIMGLTEKECKSIQNSLKKEIFQLRKKREVRLQVRKYHSNLVYLLDTIIENEKTGLFDRQELSDLVELIKEKLEELLSIVENRFSIFLSLDEKVPITYLMLSRNELQYKLEKLSKKADNTFTGKVLKIIIQSVVQFIKSFSKNKITYRQLLYQKDLLKGLKYVERFEEKNFFSDIDKVLIENNFNNAEYIDCIIEHINEEIDLDESMTYRITKLLFYKKEFDRIYSNEKLSFDPSKNNIKPILENWFEQEVTYLERKLELDVKAVSNDLELVNKAEILKSKIECDLSADQIALILRAADESRIIKSRSMNLVFQTIVPYLSTPFKKNLSYQSVRSKSYNAEDIDKEAAISGLEKIIKKIRTY
ncbi:MAG: hypothetical protein ABI850_05175 [Flavobacterium sp.]